MLRIKEKDCHSRPDKVGRNPEHLDILPEACRPIKVPLYGSAFQNPACLNFGYKGAESKKREIP